MKLHSLSTRDFISVGAVVFSIIALISSIKNCQISERALALSVLEYNSNRSLILQGEVQGTSENIKITPHYPSFLLQDLYYQFPSEVGTKRKFVNPPNYVLSLNREIDYFKKELAVRYRDDSGKLIIGENARMPFLIESFSTIKGQGYRERSIYTLNSKFQIPDDLRIEPIITISGISFVERIDRKKNAEEILEQSWNEAKSR